VSEPTHEKPYEPGWHPATVESGAQVDEENVSAVRQQYTVDPALPASPKLHASDGSLSSGVSLPVHEYPVEGELQPDTVESWAQLLGPGVPGGLTVALAVQPAAAEMMEKAETKVRSRLMRRCHEQLSSRASSAVGCHARGRSRDAGAGLERR
jgi:hypothetical protein